MSAEDVREVRELLASEFEAKIADPGDGKGIEVDPAEFAIV
ncbi:MAG: hypothetical protein NVS2B17_13410 [Candidatus Velthaea sp.]